MTVKYTHFIALICLLSTPAHGNETPHNQAHSLAQEIRCPVCLGQSIAESETPEATALKNFIFNRLQQGDSPPLILEKLRALYGDEILFQPPFTSHTLLLWLAPFGLFFIILGGVVRICIKKGKRTHA